MMDLDDILVELEKKSSLSKEELRGKIKAKQEELSGLVSMEGATHLVARELGVDLLKISNRPIKIKDIKPGMRSLKLKGRIVDISDVREFVKKNGSKGRVCNLVITDGTGNIRIPVWDKQVDSIVNSVEVGDVVALENVSARQNSYSGVELSLLATSTLQKVKDDKSIPTEGVETRKKFDRIELKDAREGFFEIRGCMVDVFNTNPIFLVCPKCKSKVEDSKCQIHGEVEPEATLIITGVIDDGTSNIRVVFFRDRARDITDLDAKNIQNLPHDEAIGIIKEEVLGKEVVLRGRIQKNRIFETLEMIVDDADEVDVKKESKELIDKIESLKWYS